MGYWGWRPLIFGVFISTWVAGCNIVTDHTSLSPVPNTYPYVTLTVGRLPTARVSAVPSRAAPTHPVTLQASPAPSPTPTHYTVQPGDTLADIARQFNVSVEALQSANDGLATLAPGQTLLIPASTPLPLEVQPPTCYETRPGSLLCLGRVDNPLDYPVEGVAVEVRLLQADGSVYLDERSAVEQTSIPSGSFAPYQATFEADASAFASADARVVSAAPSAADRFVLLLIQDVKGEPVDGRVVVSAIVYNPGPQNAEILRVFVTLLDSVGRVTGYRVVAFDDGVRLDAGAHLPLNIDVTPQASDAAPEYSFYVEARAVEN